MLGYQCPDVFGALRTCLLPCLDLLARLRELCGYYQDGSDAIVVLFQDDATRDCLVKVGNKVAVGTSFEMAIIKASNGQYTFGTNDFQTQGPVNP